MSDGITDGRRARGLDDILYSGAAWITEGELADIGAELKAAREKIRRIHREAPAIADALGERGLVDLADEVRMLLKL